MVQKQNVNLKVFQGHRQSQTLRLWHLKANIPMAFTGDLQAFVGMVILVSNLVGTRWLQTAYVRCKTLV